MTKWVISELTALANVVSVDEPVKILYIQIVLAVFLQNWIGLLKTKILVNYTNLFFVH